MSTFKIKHKRFKKVSLHTAGGAASQQPLAEIFRQLRFIINGYIHFYKFLLCFSIK